MEARTRRTTAATGRAYGRAIRVVSFYDRLMRRRVDLPAPFRSSAGPAGCVAGVRLRGRGRVGRAPPDGTDASAPPGSASTANGTATATASIGYHVPYAAAPDLLPAGVRAGVGVGATRDPVRSWREARTALRFTAARRPVVRYADLGAPTLPAGIPEDVARAHHDVAAIAPTTWPWSPASRAIRRTWRPWPPSAPRSLRRTADGLPFRLHLHLGLHLHVHLQHGAASPAGSNRSRSPRASNAHPGGLVRAALALTARRLLTTDTTTDRAAKIVECCHNGQEYSLNLVTCVLMFHHHDCTSAFDVRRGGGGAGGSPVRTGRCGRRVLALAVPRRGSRPTSVT